MFIPKLHMNYSYMAFPERPCQQPPFRTKLRWKASGLEWKHGKIRYTFFFVFLFGRCGLATYVAFIDACLYRVIHDANYACCIRSEEHTSALPSHLNLVC